MISLAYIFGMRTLMGMIDEEQGINKHLILDKKLFTETMIQISSSLAEAKPDTEKLQDINRKVCTYLETLYGSGRKETSHGQKVS